MKIKQLLEYPQAVAGPLANAQAREKAQASQATDNTVKFPNQAGTATGPVAANKPTTTDTPAATSGNSFQDATGENPANKPTPTDTPAAAPKSSWWDKTKAAASGVANAATGTLNVAGNIGAAAGNAAGSIIGAPLGGLVRGYQTARSGGSFMPGGGGTGYTGGAGSTGGGGGDANAAYQAGYQQGIQAAKSGQVYESRVGYQSKFLGIEI